jgi:hypothetical protein
MTEDMIHGNDTSRTFALLLDSNRRGVIGRGIRSLVFLNIEVLQFDAERQRLEFHSLVAFLKICLSGFADTQMYNPSERIKMGEERSHKDDDKGKMK